MKNTKNWSKFLILFLVTLLVRLVPFRAPNIEPVLTVQMPVSRVFGGVFAFMFAFLSIVLYDFLTAGLGVWTLVAGLAYGGIGFWASSYFRNKNNSPKEYLKFAIISTLVFDAVTGLTLGPVFFSQSFMSALLGQIPFTLLHLIGNGAFAYVLSPSIFSFINNNREVEQSYAVLNPQKI